MARKHKKKLKQRSEELKTKTEFYKMITAIAIPIGLLLDIIDTILKHFLK